MMPSFLHHNNIDDGAALFFSPLSVLGRGRWHLWGFSQAEPADGSKRRRFFLSLPSERFFSRFAPGFLLAPFFSFPP